MFIDDIICYQLELRIYFLGIFNKMIVFYIRIIKYMLFNDNCLI